MSVLQPIQHSTTVSSAATTQWAVLSAPAGRGTSQRQMHQTAAKVPNCTCCLPVVHGFIIIHSGQGGGGGGGTEVHSNVYVHTEEYPILPSNTVHLHLPSNIIRTHLLLEHIALTSTNDYIGSRPQPG